MKKNRIIQIGLMIGIILPILLGVISTEYATAKPEAVVLQCITRHDGVIYNLYEDRFKQKYPAVSDIQWLEISDPQQWPSAILSPSYSIDLLWGGGPSVFNIVADRGLMNPISNQTIEDTIKAAVPEKFGGADMMRLDSNDDILWVSAAVSSFGFTVNYDNLALYGLDTPHTWEELASPDYFLGTTQHAIGMGNAPGTTSNTRVYQIILQKFGWEAGWDIITRMAGNSNIFPESGDTRDSVLLEQAVAMTIDFYGYQVQAQSSVCEYITPTNESIINGDPIAIASTATGEERDYAEKFVEFVMSPEGQGLWLHPQISRLPMVYEAFSFPYNDIPRPDIESNWFKAESGGGIYFDEDLAGDLYDTVIWYFEATLTDSTTLLYSAWESIVNAYNAEEISEEEFRSLTREMTDPSITLSEALIISQEIEDKPNIKETYIQQWKTQAVSRYQSIASKVSDEVTDNDDDGSFFDEFEVSISGPLNGSIATGMTNFEATAVDYGDWSFLYGVKEVNFYIDDMVNPFATVKTPDSRGSGTSVFSTEWNTSEYVEGPHTLKVVAKEETNRTVQDQALVYVNIVKDLPPATISLPIEGATVNELVSITGSADSNEDFNPAYVTIAVSGSEGQVYSVNISSGFLSISTTWNTTDVPNGEYTISMTVTYDTGNTKQASVTVTVYNESTTTTWEATPGFEGIGLFLGLLVVLGFVIRKRRRF